MTTLDWLILAGDGPVRGVRLHARVHRRRAVARSASSRAPSPARGSPRRCCRAARSFALRAAVRAVRRAARGRDPRESASRASAAAAARAAAAVARRRSTGCSARCSAPRSRSGIAWVLGAAVLALPGAGALRAEVRARSILRRLDELMPPSGAAAQRARSRRPAAGDRRTGAPPSLRPARSSRALRRSPSRARSVVRVLGTRVRPRHRGLRLGGRARRGASPTRTSSPASATLSSRSAASRLTCLRRRSSSTSTTTSRCCASPGLALAPLTLAPTRARGPRGAILGYPQDGPFAVVAARIGATRAIVTQDAYGRGPVTRAAHAGARRGPPRQLGRSGARRARARADDGLRGDDQPGPARRLRRRQHGRSRATLAHANEADLDTGACGGLTLRCPLRCERRRDPRPS